MDYQKQKFLTKQGLAKIRDELEFLKNQKRRDIVQKIKEAKEQGDLSENAEYSEAKEEQAFVEGRILELEEMVKNSEVVAEDMGVKDEISVGTSFRAVSEGKEYAFTLVGPQEVDPKEGRISYESPIGMAFMGKKTGDIVEVEVPRGRVSYRIEEIC